MKKLLITLMICLLFAVCSNSETKEKKFTNGDFKIHFIELGSVRCIPCRKMMRVMDSIEKRFKGQIKITFYDVWTPEQKKYAYIYGVNGIPTQVFLDEKGNEIYRHVGFFPEEKLAAFLISKGLNDYK